MMFKNILFTTLFATAAAEVTVDAAQKKTLLSKARKLENNQQEEDMSWLAKHSVKVRRFDSASQPSSNFSSEPIKFSRN